MATKNQIENVKVERLGNNNFCIWKRWISYLLTHERIIYTIQDDEPTIGSANWAKWQDDNELAKATILSHMNDDLIPLYEGLSTAKKITDTLEDKYGPKYETYI